MSRMGIAPIVTRLLLVFAVGAACTRTTSSPTPRRPAAARPPPAPEWPVPVRVLVRTDSGEVVEHGTLPPAPGHVTALPDDDRWFVEPIDLDLDDREIEGLIREVKGHRVPGLSLRGARRIGDHAVLRIGLFLNLRVLDLTGTRATGAGLLALKSMTDLRALYLGGTKVTDDDLASLAAQHPALEAIDLEGCAIGDAGVRALAALPLRQIGLASTGITDTGADALRAHVSRLVSLDLGETNTGDGGLAWLASATALIDLGLWRTQVTNRLMPLLEYTTRLRVLDLSETAVDDAGITTLHKNGVIYRLTSLDISSTKVTDRSGSLLRSAMQLESLDIGGTRLGNRGVAAVTGMTRLRFLSLRRLTFEEFHLVGLRNLKAMRHLDLGETGVTSDVAPYLDSMAELSELYLDVTSIEDDAVVTIAARHPDLRVLHLDDNALGAPAARALASLTSLTELTLGETELPEEQVAIILAALPRLEILDLSSLRMTDTIAPSIAHLVHLHTLDLSKNEISDAGLSALQPLVRLRVLGLQSTRVTRTRAEIVAAFPGLQDLVTD